MVGVRECGHYQTMNHVVDMCLLAKFEVVLQSLHNVDDDTLSWVPQ